jgi:hypothetical protein
VLQEILRDQLTSALHRQVHLLVSGDQDVPPDLCPHLAFFQHSRTFSFTPTVKDSPALEQDFDWGCFCKKPDVFLKPIKLRPVLSLSPSPTLVTTATCHPQMRLPVPSRSQVLNMEEIQLSSVVPAEETQLFL